MIVPYLTDHVKGKESEEKQTCQVVFSKRRKLGRARQRARPPDLWSTALATRHAAYLRPCLAPGKSQPQHVLMRIVRITSIYQLWARGGHKGPSCTLEARGLAGSALSLGWVWTAWRQAQHSSLKVEVSTFSQQGESDCQDRLEPHTA